MHHLRPKYVGLPGYLLTDEYDKGAVPQLNGNGEISGWVAKRWNPKVQERFALLMKALGKEFDGKVEGINLQETAIEDISKIDFTFTQESYTESLKINMLALKKAFPRSVTMQYANFVPGGWLRTQAIKSICILFINTDRKLGLAWERLIY